MEKSLSVKDFKPLHEMILVRLVPESNERKSGSIIVLDDKNAEHFIKATVVKVSSKCMDKEHDEIEVGDVVLVERFAGINVTMIETQENEVYRLYNYADIMAVVVE